MAIPEGAALSSFSSSSEDAEKPCCISHLFYRVATSSPNKPAVVHAFGSRGHQFPESSIEEWSEDEQQRSSSSYELNSSSRFPLIYPGDEVFTYSEILTSVENLCRRIVAVLGGGDDPCLLRPSGQCGLEEGAKFMLSEEHSGPCLPKLIGVCIPPSVYYIVAILAILRIGEAFLPLDPYWPKQRVLSVSTFSKVALLIGYDPSIDTKDKSRTDFNWLVEESSIPCLLLSDSQMKGDFTECLPKSISWPCGKESLRSYCYVMFTSGSTGRPKGVCGTERGLLNRFQWMNMLFPPNPKDVLLFKTAISFVDHLQELFSAVLASSLLVVPSHLTKKSNPLHLIDIVKEYRVTRLTVVPSLLRAIAHALES